MNISLPVENHDVPAALRGLLKRLVENGIIDAVLVPLEHGGGVVSALVTDTARLEDANPFLPVMPINNSRGVSGLTGSQAPARLGVVLRSCEIRALVELVKLQQVSLDNVILIGIDCPGTIELDDFLKGSSWQGENRVSSLKEYLSAAQEGNQPHLSPDLRVACRMCIHPVPEDVDIHIHLIGADTTVVLPVTMRDEIAQTLNFTESAPGEAWNREDAGRVLERLTAERHEFREKELAATRVRMNADGGLLGMFSDCIRCHNCSTACPICYCKTCLFRTAAFDHEPEHYFIAARRKGAARMPGDVMLFHLTRMSHMAASCVSCGMCTSACPANIPVGSIFSVVGEQVQAAFNYQPGRDASQALPLITFQPDEWTEIGEEK